MKKSLIIGIITIFSLFGLTACDPNSTKDLIVFEENIGMPDDFLGIYKLSLENNDKNPSKNGNIQLALYYDNSKYHVKLFGNDPGFVFFIKGTFIPSKVNGKSDYYIMSLPEGKFTYFREGAEDGEGVPVLGSRFGSRKEHNVLVFLKKEKGKLLIWTSLLNEKILNGSKDNIKKEIEKSYTQTFIDKPLVFSKQPIPLSSLPNRLENETMRFTEEFDAFRKRVKLLDKKKKNQEYLKKLSLYIIIKEFKPNEYKIIDKFNNEETRVIVQRLNGREEVLSSDEEKVKLISKALNNSTEKDTVVDKLTGLMWQDNIDSKGRQDNLYNAQTYCSSLSLLGYSDWKLPTQSQFKTILAKNKSAIKSEFKMFASDVYWAPLAKLNPFGTEHTMNWKDGDIGRYQKRNHHHVRCVRKVKEKADSQIKENSSPSNKGLDFGDMFTDMKESAISMSEDAKEAEYSSISKWITPSNNTCKSNGGTVKSNGCKGNWLDAKNICSASEGRLPTIEELRKIISGCGGRNLKVGNGQLKKNTDKNKANLSYQSCYKAKGFTSDDHWSSSSYVSNDRHAWYVDFKYGYTYNHNKTHDEDYVRCVRGRQ